MLTFTSPDPLPLVTARLQKAGEGFWNPLLVETTGGTLALQCSTLWKDGPLWRLQGRLEGRGSTTRLSGELRCSWSNLLLPYLMIAALFLMLAFQAPPGGFSLHAWLVVSFMFTPATLLRFLTGLGERQRILTALEQAGLHQV